jgi:hypothetical protein
MEVWVEGLSYLLFGVGVLFWLWGNGAAPWGSLDFI